MEEERDSKSMYESCPYMMQQMHVNPQQMQQPMMGQIDQSSGYSLEADDDDRNGSHHHSHSHHHSSSHSPYYGYYPYMKCPPITECSSKSFSSGRDEDECGDSRWYHPHHIYHHHIHHHYMHPWSWKR